MIIIRKIFLIILLVNTCLIATSQEANFSFDKKESYQEKLKILYSNDSYLLFTGEDTKKEIVLYKYSTDNVSLISKKELRFPVINGEQSEYLNIFYCNDKVCLFTTVFNKKNKYYTLYVTQYNNTGEVLINEKVVDEIKWTNKCFSSTYKLAFSSDSSKILIYHKIDECDDKSTKGKYAFKILGENMNILLHKEFELPFGFSKYYLSKFLVDKSNNISFIESQYENSNDKLGDLFKISIVTYNSTQDKLVRTEIDINEKRYLNLDLQLTPKEDVLLTGAYAIDRDFGGSWEGISSLKGVFCALIDKNSNNISVKYKKDLDVLLTGDKKTEFHNVSLTGFTFMVDNGKNLYRYRLKNTFQLENNQIVLFVQFEHSINGTYVKGPIIAINFNLKNEQEGWIKAYGFQDTKSNSTNNTESFSYIPFVRNGKINVLYNFNRRLQINSNGESIDNTIYLETKDNKNLFLCKIMSPIKSSTLFILGTEHNSYENVPDYKICKITFKD
ncbi:MAG: hypothetical protein IPH32_02305 [Bacteroidetes bacterium]|nr:hypothetical protein [Bacteroidota bacterium]